MSSSARQSLRPLVNSVRCLRQEGQSFVLPIRAFSSSSAQSEAAAVEQSTAQSTPGLLDPNLVYTAKAERKLLQTQRKTPIGSRRRRAALQSSNNIPFEQLPYQCFQEARKILGEDREEKLKQIEVQRARIARLTAQQVSPQDERQREHRLASMQRHLQELKILADINDPIVKKRFEDGQGDMNKPIYRFLADKEWRKYKRNLAIQRITQMNVVPDVLPAIDIVANVDLSFGNRAVQPGEFVDSRVSEIPARLKIQVYNKGERYVTIAVVNPDVPDVAKDGFGYRCHFLASNINISPTSGSVPLSQLARDSQVILPWLPAFTQKGAPYQRMSVFVLEQQQGQIIDVKAATEKVEREGFKLRGFVDRYTLKPVGANLFRSQYDEGTAGVMQRAGIPGHDVEFKRMKVEPLPYKKLPGSRYR
ncbi:hypothetical protein AAFC00_003407 [Neodothiora populina]|uniref:PEBP-like protein n=1 Tax=Neodothiora populina TaxID=2781224 RepID=A0ABR3PE46_9PEZI